MEHGRVAAAGDLPTDDDWHSGTPGMAAAPLGREEYERLRLLTTELRRLVSDGPDPVVCLPTGRCLHGDRLTRLLEWL